MPTYEYRCEHCTHQYEKREGFDAPAKQKCPKCGKQARRMISAPSVVFKGSGFYKTDSRGVGTSEPASSTGDKKDAGGDAATKTPDAPAKSDDTSKKKSTTSETTTEAAAAN